MEVVIPVLFVVLVGILLFILRQVPERSALLTGLGIAMTFIIGLTFVMLTPSFNENWSINTAKDAGRYHSHLHRERSAGGRCGRPRPARLHRRSRHHDRAAGWLHDPAAARAAYLSARRLYVLPFAADSASGRRNQALFHRHIRSADCRRARIHLGSAALSGNAPHWAGPVPRGRQVQRRLALLALLLPAPDGPRLHHAGLYLAV